MTSVFICAGCGLLSSSQRNDAMTCSPACRVRAHRSGELKRLRALAEDMRIMPATILHARAVKELCPELSDQITAGKFHWREDPFKRPEIVEAFYNRLSREIERARSRR